MDAVQIDAVDDPESCRIAEEIQRRAWGMSDRGLVPAEQIRAAVHNGGLLLIARSGGEPIGFCYGFVGLDDRMPILCSHMLAVVPGLQSRGVGRALKMAQRRHAAERGFDRITWTFDPLQARNAYLNLHRLGAIARRYHVDHYGPMDDAINAGLPSDRLLAEWAVDTERRVPPAAPDGPWALTAVASADRAPHPGTVTPDAVRGDAALVAVPADIDQLREVDPGAGPAWRNALRAALSTAFEAGMTAVDLVRDVGDDCHAYVLRTRP
jgi:predicted GNAT superfamily acetyltransferase